jgi:hypothetical protein
VNILRLLHHQTTQTPTCARQLWLNSYCMCSQPVQAIFLEGSDHSEGIHLLSPQRVVDLRLIPAYQISDHILQGLPIG